MSYAAISDLVQRFGNQELVQLTDRATPPSSEIDQDVAQAALDAASADMDGYISAKYQLPLANSSPVLVGICCDLARYRLFPDQVPEKVRDDNTAAFRKLEHIAKGTLKIDAAGVEPAPRPSVVITSGQERRTDRSTLRDF